MASQTLILAYAYVDLVRETCELQLRCWMQRIRGYGVCLVTGWCSDTGCKRQPLGDAMLPCLIPALPPYHRRPPARLPGPLTAAAAGLLAAGLLAAVAVAPAAVAVAPAAAAVAADRCLLQRQRLGPARCLAPAGGGGVCRGWMLRAARRHTAGRWRRAWQRRWKISAQWGRAWRSGAWQAWRAAGQWAVRRVVMPGERVGWAAHSSAPVHGELTGSTFPKAPKQNARHGCNHPSTAPRPSLQPSPAPAHLTSQQNLI